MAKRAKKWSDVERELFVEEEIAAAEEFAKKEVADLREKTQAQLAAVKSAQRR